MKLVESKIEQKFHELKAMRQYDRRQIENEQNVSSAEKMQNIFGFLEQSGLEQMSELTLLLHDVAPNPGSLVYVQAKRLHAQLEDWRPIVFLSIDVYTHLQLGKIYLTPTIAAAIDFLEYIELQYPFPMAEVRTPHDQLFTSEAILQTEHPFTRTAQRSGIFHSVMTEPTNDRTYGIVTKYLFEESLHYSSTKITEHELVSVLHNFLFFHNNHRSLPTLRGKTPLQRLQMTGNFEREMLFDTEQKPKPRITPYR